ncbi:hypothetical protein F4823DRAFT_636553 [Ustulina deusta]|nr:hypothetical protein F4823DRAFT_636553 [Ustulina deusta]
MNHNARGHRGGRGGGFGRGRGGRFDAPVVSNPNVGTYTGTIAGNSHQIAQMLSGIPAGTYISANVAFGPSQSNTPEPRGTKRDPSNDNTQDEPHKRKKTNKRPQEPEVIDPNACGNCGGTSHKAAFCVMRGGSGWMEACPKCDSTRHLYEVCPRRVKGREDFIYLIFNRQRKPPVKSTMSLVKVISNEIDREGSQWNKTRVLDLPYSSLYSRQEARQNPPAAYVYKYVGNPTEEAKQRLAEPARFNVSLGDACRVILAGQLWSPAEENYNPELDGPTPVAPDTADRLPHRPAPIRFPFQSNLGRTALQRARAVAAIRLVEPVPPTYCSNCDSSEHVITVCDNPCSACGSPNHTINICLWSKDACVCEEIPGHLLKNCKLLCNFCMASGNPSPHRAVECPVVCHSCLAKDHNTKECSKRRMYYYGKHCLLCRKNGDGEQFHLPTNCVWNWCPVDQCKDPLDCKNHCKGCGWDKDRVDDFDLRGHHHHCQFGKVWNYEKLNDAGLPTVQLQCLRSKDHKFSHSELTHLHATVLQEIEAMLPAPEGGINPLPIECPKCRQNSVDIEMD